MSTRVPPAKGHAVVQAAKLLGAASLAVFGIALAWQRVASFGDKPSMQGAAYDVPERGPVPDFWLREHAAGRAEARRTGKPVFLVIRCEP
jgi:hypothetical protein